MFLLNFPFSLVKILGFCLLTQSRKCMIQLVQSTIEMEDDLAFPMLWFNKKNTT